MNAPKTPTLAKVVLLATAIIGGCDQFTKDPEIAAAEEQFHQQVVSYSDCLDTKIAELPATESIPESFITDCHQQSLVQENSENK